MVSRKKTLLHAYFQSLSNNFFFLQSLGLNSLLSNWKPYLVRTWLLHWHLCEEKRSKGATRECARCAIWRLYNTSPSVRFLLEEKQGRRAPCEYLGWSELLKVVRWLNFLIWCHLYPFPQFITHFPYKILNFANL